MNFGICQFRVVSAAQLISWKLCMDASIAIFATTDEAKIKESGQQTAARSVRKRFYRKSRHLATSFNKSRNGYGL